MATSPSSPPTPSRVAGLHPPRAPQRASRVGSLGRLDQRAETLLPAAPLRWPLLPVPDAQGQLAWPDLESSVRDAIQILLATRPGEQLQHPEFGVGLEHALQRPNTVALRADLERRLRAALARHEPRIVSEALEVAEADGGRALQITLRYRIVASGLVRGLSARVQADAAQLDSEV